MLPYFLLPYPEIKLGNAMSNLSESPTEAVIPNFFVVGAAKSGTTSLEFYLQNNPDVFICPIKEPHYFCKDIDTKKFTSSYKELLDFDINTYLNKRPLENKHIAFVDDYSNYINLFDGVSNEKAIGELSTGYLYSTVAAEEIYKYNSKAKIIIILRQPVERAYSHYLMNLEGFKDYSSDFHEAVSRDFNSGVKGWGITHLYVELGLYYEQIKRYLDIFPAEQVKIILFEDFIKNTDQSVVDILKFLDVSTDIADEASLGHIKNSSSITNINITGDIPLKIFNITKNILKKIIISPRLRYIIKQRLITHSPPPKLSDDEFYLVLKYFENDIARLSDILGKDLTHWLTRRAR